MMRRPGSIKLMDVFGIRVGVDATWFLILFLMIIWISGAFRDALPLHTSGTVVYATTVVTALLFFGSLIFHELGHALVARRQGIEVKRIELFLFGGITQMSRDAASPGEELKISGAGPLATLCFVLLCLIIDLLIVGPHRLVHAIQLDVRVTPVLLGLSWLLLMNVLILIFNLVPAFPLDGGRMARALIWRVTGDKQRGTRAAARLGQWFAVLLAGVGIAWLLAYGTLGGLWLVALAFLLGQSARGAIVQSTITERIEGVRVADIMDRQPVAIPSETAVTQALDEYFLRYRWSWFPVIDPDGRFIGVARQERVQATHDGGEGWLTTGAVAESEEVATWRVQEDRPLTELLSSEPLGRLGALMAVDGEGVLRGVVTVEQVRRALQSAFGSPAG